MNLSRSEAELRLITVTSSEDDTVFSVSRLSCLLSALCPCRSSVGGKYVHRNGLFVSDRPARRLVSCVRPALLSSCPSCLILPSDLTELQVAVSDVNGRYETLGEELKDRLGRQQASLELRQKARQGTEELGSWLTDREHSLKQGQIASPSRPEAVRAQAQENKVS